MASKNHNLQQAVVELGNASKNPAAEGILTAAKQNMAAAKIEDFITKTLAAAPPLTREQLRILANMLVPGDEK